MKKTNFFSALCLFLSLGFFAFASPTVNSKTKKVIKPPKNKTIISNQVKGEIESPAVDLTNEKKFIKGSINDKISILQSLKSDEILTIGKSGLDFSIENASLLGDDEDLARLAAASVKAFPKNISENDLRSLPSEKVKDIPEKFIAIFRLFKNADVRYAVMERLEYYCLDNKNLLVDFVNDYLVYACKSGEKSSPEHGQLISLIGRVGNEASLSIIYNIWALKLWPEYKPETDEALLNLSKNSFSDVIKILSLSKIGDFRDFFLLLKNFSGSSQKFLCDVAENALLIAINNVEKLKGNSDSEKRDFALFQVESSEILTANEWSHSANVINENFLLAKKAWEKGEMTESDFVKIISSAPKVPSNALAKSMTDFLSECNGKVQKDNAEMPAKSVVLALISALGDLGDKTAFDTLLYSTYLSYPVDVIDEAKKSLAKVNW